MQKTDSTGPAQVVQRWWTAASTPPFPSPVFWQGGFLLPGPSLPLGYVGITRSHDIGHHRTQDQQINFGTCDFLARQHGAPRRCSSWRGGAQDPERAGVWSQRRWSEATMEVHRHPDWPSGCHHDPGSDIRNQLWMVNESLSCFQSSTCLRASCSVRLKLFETICHSLEVRTRGLSLLKILYIRFYCVFKKCMTY